MTSLSFDSPVGALTIVETDGAITAVNWGGGHRDTTPLLQKAKAQLMAYFAGELTEFDLPLQVQGSDFQRQVCDQISAIPYGDTKTYGDLAKALDKSAQAIGTACGGNPIPIIIPCHRVMGAGGKLTGFSGAGGVETKVALLRLEGAAGLLI